VSTAKASGRPTEFQFRRLEKPEEFRQAEELEREAFGPDSPPILPAPLLRTVQDNGGLVLGGFADIYLAGCAISTIGWDGTTLYHYSHVTAVRPEYRNHHLGFRLMAFQRDEVLRLGLSEIRWTIDPLASRAAGLSVHRLGGIPDRYLLHYFGQPSDASETDRESDRLHVRWVLTAPGVERRLEGTATTPQDDLRRWEFSEAIVETELGASGLRLPSAVAEPTAPRAHLEIPFDLSAIREHEAASLRRWRHAVRDAFRAAFDLGYVVDDFSVVSAEHERRSFYFLSKPEPSAGRAPASES
jgi:predicted GNAT superfamily acetyltransferase